MKKRPWSTTIHVAISQFASITMNLHQDLYTPKLPGWIVRRKPWQDRDIFIKTSRWSIVHDLKAWSVYASIRPPVIPATRTTFVKSNYCRPNIKYRWSTSKLSQTTNRHSKLFHPAYKTKTELNAKYQVKVQEQPRKTTILHERSMQSAKLHSEYKILNWPNNPRKILLKWSAKGPKGSRTLGGSKLRNIPDTSKKPV